jgi:hypothetical protein
VSIDQRDGGAHQVPTTAADVRRMNAELDDALLQLIDWLDPERLAEPETVAPDAEAWNAAIVIGHLGEFPHFFANELRRWHASSTAEVGRTVVADERLDAIAAAHDRDLAELRRMVTSAFTDLSDALEVLTDADMTAQTQNRKYGTEPMTAFLDRYLLGHKRGHLDQLRAMPAAADRGAMES